jgi:hypothetical protein
VEQAFQNVLLLAVVLYMFVEDVDGVRFGVRDRVRVRVRIRLRARVRAR